jgi:hypothetical protein
MLDATPGAPVIVYDTRVTTTAFSITVPPGWRTITSPADQPPFVTTAAPGNCALIVIAASPQRIAALADECGGTQTVSRAMIFDHAAISVTGRASASEWAAFIAVFDAVAQSVTAP